MFWFTINRLLIGAPRKVIIYNIQTARKLYFYIPHQMPFRKCSQWDTKGQLLESQLMEKKTTELSGDYKEKTLYTWNLFCPLFWGFNPPKEGLFQSKQGSFGFQAGPDLTTQYHGMQDFHCSNSDRTNWNKPRPPSSANMTS